MIFKKPYFYHSITLYNNKNPGLTLGVSLVSKSQLRLIFPATNKLKTPFFCSRIFIPPTSTYEAFCQTSTKNIIQNNDFLFYIIK